MELVHRNTGLEPGVGCPGRAPGASQAPVVCPRGLSIPCLLGSVSGFRGRPCMQEYPVGSFSPFSPHLFLSPPLLHVFFHLCSWVPPPSFSPLCSSLSPSTLPSSPAPSLCCPAPFTRGVADRELPAGPVCSSPLVGPPSGFRCSTPLPLEPSGLEASKNIKGGMKVIFLTTKSSFSSSLPALPSALHSPSARGSW